MAQEILSRALYPKIDQKIVSEFLRQCGSKELMKKREKEIIFSILHLNDRLILGKMKEKIDECIALECQREVEGHKTEILLLSATLMLHQDMKIKIKNGALQELRPGIESNIRIDCVIGKDGRGWAGFEFTDGPIEDDPFAIEEKFRHALDKAIKSARKNYFHRVGDSVDEVKEFIKVAPCGVEEYYEEDTFCEENITELIRNLKRASLLLSKDEDIEDSSIELEINHNTKYFVNSDGVKTKTIDRDIQITIFATTYVQDGKIEYGEKMLLRGTEQPELAEILSKVIKVRTAIKELKHCKRQPAVDDWPAIVTGLGTIAHESTGHLFEEHPDPDEEGETFRNRSGERVVAPIVTIHDDPTIPGAWGSYVFDDEGVRARKVTLIKDGIVKDMLSSRLTAGRRGAQSNGHARTERFVYVGIGDEETEKEIWGPLGIPVPRMSNLIVELNTHTVDDIEELKRLLIERCKAEGKEYGLILLGFESGAVDPKTGQFTYTPHDAFRLYLDGRLERVRDVLCTFDALEVWSKIEAATRQLEEQRGFCERKEGRIPTSDFAPAVLMRIKTAMAKPKRKRAPLLPKPKQEQQI